MAKDLLEKFVVLVSLFLDSPKLKARERHDGAEWSFWANQNLMTPIFFLMDVVWLSQGAFEELTPTGSRIWNTIWISHTDWSWEYKPGYGGRVLPTKATKTAIGASYNGPTGTIEPNSFADEDAEAVKQKHLEEVREEEELSEMVLHDRVAPKAIEIQEEPEVQIAEPSMEGGTFTDEGEMTVAHAPKPILQSRASSFLAPALPMDAPQTPDVGVETLVTPRHSPTTRTHGIEGDDDHEAKRARVEAAKKQRLDRINSEYSSMIWAVKISNETYHTMDDYDSELRLDDHEVEDGWKDDDAGEVFWVKFQRNYGLTAPLTGNQKRLNHGLMVWLTW